MPNDVRAVRDALSELTHVFSGFPYDSSSSSRPSLKGDLLYRAILRNPAEVFRLFRQFTEAASADAEREERSETYRMDVFQLFLRWKELPPFRHCAFHWSCHRTAGFVVADASEGGGWTELRFSEKPWLVCDRGDCQRRAAKKERFSAWEAVPLDVETLTIYVGQEFDDLGLREYLRADAAARRALYAEQERYGDQLVRLYDFDGTPYGTSPKDLWRARKFFKILPPNRLPPIGVEPTSSP